MTGTRTKRVKVVTSDDFTSGIPGANVYSGLRLRDGAQVRTALPGGFFRRLFGR